MIRSKGFPRGIEFAALATATWLPWAFTFAPWIGIERAFGLHMTLAVGIYFVAIAPQPARGFRLALVAMSVAVAFELLPGSRGEFVPLLALLLGIGRSVFLYRRPAARAVAVEAVLLALTSGLAALPDSPCILSASLSIWSFFLVQSCFFLVRISTTRDDIARLDAFDDAHQRALALLDRSCGPRSGS